MKQQILEKVQLMEEKNVEKKVATSVEVQPKK
jgi:hypothetical protein